MNRTLQTTDDEDAAIAWQLKAVNSTTTPPITEAQFVARAAHEALHPLVVAYLEHEARSIGEAARIGTKEQRTDARIALGLDRTEDRP